MTKVLDERGHECPLPVVNTRKACREIAIGDKLTVKVSKSIQISNLKELAEENGFGFESKQISDTEYVATITKTKEMGNAVKDDACTCGGKGANNMVVVISSNQMGAGEEKLGKNLLKAFIFAVTKQEQLPNNILFYNSGAYLTCEGSESLEDLMNLEKAGVKIFTCGTCLDFYGMKEKLKVGQVTNMYDIVAMQEKASIIIRP